MQFTLQQFKKIFGKCKEPEAWQPVLSEALKDWTLEETANFLAQTAHESSEFNVLEENLRYSAEGLRSVFGKYFRNKDANAYAKKPEKIANLVYANRMGNGNEASGDGYKFRGRGILQITGFNNYQACGESICLRGTFIQNPDLLLTKQYAVASAMWFFEVNGLRKIKDFAEQTRRINGGYNGLDDRTAIRERVITSLTYIATVSSFNSSPITLNKYS